MTTSVTEKPIDTYEHDAEGAVHIPAEGTGAAESRRSVSDPRRWFHALATLGRRAAAIVCTVLAILLIAAVTTTIVLAHRTSEHDAVDAAARAARSAAETRVPQVLSYDFNNIDTEFPKVTSNLTGKFADDFGKLSSSVIIPAAHKDSIVTKASVVGTSVVSAQRTSVTLLLFLNQETTSTSYQGPRMDGSRVRVTMAESGGDWLISEITPV